MTPHLGYEGNTFKENNEHLMFAASISDEQEFVDCDIQLYAPPTNGHGSPVHGAILPPRPHTTHLE